MRSLIFLPAALVLASGCGPDEDQPALDSDGDHWVRGYDCDDHDADVHPYADEYCNGVDDDCDGRTDEDDAVDAPVWYADADADGYGANDYAWKTCEAPSGYVANNDDCDDLDAAVSPDALEACDDVDNDCDGEVDETGATDPDTWWRDADDDGYGDPEYRVEGCAGPDGYVDNDEDCDDSDEDINPASPEVCDLLNKDEDCDGLADDEDTGGALDPETWYVDADGDTYGDPLGAVVQYCDQPNGYSASADDCDDADRAINPASPEVCGDGVDNNCDGLLDDEDEGAEPVNWYADADGDGYADRSSWVGESCVGPSGTVTSDAGWDCDDTDADVNPGMTERWYDGVDSDCDDASDFDADADGFDSDAYSGEDCNDRVPAINPDVVEVCDDFQDNDCDGVIDACFVIAALMGVASGDDAGTSVAPAGDVNGDGFDELLVGADREDTAGAGAGSAYVVLGPQSGELRLDAAYAQLTGEDLGDHAGISVAGVGDADGDGYPDLLVGAYECDRTDTSAGAAYLVGGPVSGLVSLSDATGTLLGEAAGNLAGFSVAAAGDVDGDGLADLLVGAYGEDTNGAYAGAAYVVRGPLTQSTWLWTADARLRGEAAGDQAGYAVAGAGDTDGDGLDDIVVGAPFEHGSGTYTGAAYLVLGTPRGTFDLDSADAKWTGRNAGDLAGFSVGGGGDLDGDGYADVVVGAPDEDSGGGSAGAVYLLYGPLDEDGSLDEADAVLLGEDNDDYAGSAVAVAGDLDADGMDDLLLGARLEDTAKSNAGAAYFVLGPVWGEVELSEADGKVLGDVTEDWLGYAVSSAGDFDGDGIDDAAVGAPFYDGFGASDVGVVWILPGGGWP